MSNGNSDFLTPEEIQRLASSSADTKIDIARNLAKYCNNGHTEDSQLKIAEQVFRTLQQDAEVKVRKNLADAIKNLQEVPHDLIVSLAKDIEEVSLPVLQFSEILSESDILNIIDSAQSEEKYLAISKRNAVSGKVSDALIDTKKDVVVGSLIQNINANISEESLRKAVENHTNSEYVLGSMIERGSLPIAVVERLTGTISNELYKKLSQKHAASMGKIEEVIKKSREVATMRVIGLKSSDEAFREFSILMDKLKISEDLMPIAALCIANMNVFEVSLAKTTKVPVLNIRELLKDTTNQGFVALYTRASLPPHLLEPSKLLLDILRKFHAPSSGDTEIRLTHNTANRFIDEIVARSKEKGVPEHLDYLISLIKLAAGHEHI